MTSIETLPTLGISDVAQSSAVIGSAAAAITELPTFEHVYVHLPFCEIKCPYCDFFSLVDDTQKADFVPLLLEEIEAAAQRWSFSPKVKTLFLGGGTPTHLETQELRAILEALFLRIEFAEDAEITMEANPESARREILERARELGINRLSIGVQSFDDLELKYLGRIHDANRAKRAVSEGRSAGYKNINIDLMFGFAGQTLKSWDHSLLEAVDTEVEHISAYSLMLDGKSGFASSPKPEQHILDDETTRKMFEVKERILGDAGYAAYEISNHSRPGFESKHNMAYWQRRPYVGFGPSAHSGAGQWRWWNVRNLSGYLSGVAKHRHAISGYEKLTEEQIFTETVMLRIRMSEGVGEDSMGAEQWRRLSQRAEPLVRKGLLEAQGQVLKLTSRGVPISDAVIAHLIS